MAMHAVTPLRRNRIRETSAGLAQAAILTNRTMVAVNHLVFQVLQILLRSQNLFQLVKIATARLLHQLTARLTLPGAERIHSRTLLVAELDSGKRINRRLTYLASRTLLAASRAVATSALRLALLLTRLLGRGGECSDAHSCEENEMFHNHQFFQFSQSQTPPPPQSLITPGSFKHP